MYLEPYLVSPPLRTLTLPLKSSVVPLSEVAWGITGPEIPDVDYLWPLCWPTYWPCQQRIRGCVTRNIFNLQAFLLAGCLMKTCPPELSTGLE